MNNKQYNNKENNNDFLDTQEDKENKDVFTLSKEEILEYKKQRTKIHVVLKKRVSGEIVETQRFSFETEDDARDYAESLALSESFVSLDLWQYKRNDISDMYILKDETELFYTTYIINIYPVQHKI